MRIRVIKNGHPLSLDERNIIRSAYRQDEVSVPDYFKRFLPDYEKYEGHQLWIGCVSDGLYTYSEYMTID